LDRLFEKAAEEQPAEVGSAPIEAERELVKVGLEMIPLDGALVRAKEPSFGKAGDPVNPYQQRTGLLP
jgi:hypothetical protein